MTTQHYDTYCYDSLDFLLDQNHPGPFEIHEGTDGCDKTFDIYCLGTTSYVTSTHAWDEREGALAEARQIVRDLQVQQGRC